MKSWFLITALVSLAALASQEASAQTPTPTCPPSSPNFTDDFAGASSLTNFDYWGDHWSSQTAASLNYGVAGGQLVVGGPSAIYSFALLKDTQVPHATASGVLEADFKQDNGPGLFGLVFRADAAVSQAYSFQWNGMNGRWEIEKKMYGSPGFSSYEYVAAGNPIPAYSYGTWVHLRVVFGPGNSYSGYADLNDGSGERTVFSGAVDTTPSLPPYTDGAVGLRIYEASSTKPIQVDNFQVNACGTPTPSPTPTPTATGTPTATLTPLPLAQGEGRIHPSPARRGPASLAFKMKEAGRMECRLWNANGELASKVSASAGAGDGILPLDLSGFAPGVFFYSLLFIYDSGKTENSPTKKLAVVP